MNILCVSLSEMGLWMNIFWIYRSRYTSCVGTRPAVQGTFKAFKRFNEGSKKFNSSMRSRNVQEFKRFKGSKGSVRSRVQLIKRTINTFNWFKEVQRFGERSIRSRVQMFKPQKLYWFKVTKLLHRAMLRNERRCGSRRFKPSIRAKARSEGSSAVPGETQWNQGKLLVKV